jgi:hypothetical protein
MEYEGRKPRNVRFSDVLAHSDRRAWLRDCRFDCKAADAQARKKGVYRNDPPPQ